MLVGILIGALSVGLVFYLLLQLEGTQDLIEGDNDF